MKIIFMGTPDFACQALRTVAEKNEVVCVYTQPPRPSGRGHQMTSSPVQQLAESMNILVRSPVSLKSQAEQDAFAALKADVAVVCAYGLLLPFGILQACPKGCINIHASLLPRWRGAAPIQRAIMAGDTQSGVTIMQMDEGLDTGAILMMQSVPIGPTTTAGELHDALSALGAQMIGQVLADIPTPTPQPKDGMTYAQKLTKEECAIDWSQPAAAVSAHIRGLSPYPKAFFMKGQEKIFVLMAEVEKGATATTTAKAGTVIDDALAVACGDGHIVRLTRLQRAGKAPVLAKDFLNGFHVAKGTQL